MNPLSADHFWLEVAGIFEFELVALLLPLLSANGVVDAIWAMFLANRARSSLSSFCRLFRAPGRDFVDFRLMILTCCSGLLPAGPSASPSSSSGSASAKASSVVMSFLFDLLRLGFFVPALVTLDMSCACLIRRLSFLLAAKRDSAFSGLCTRDVEEDVFRMDLAGFEVR